MAAGTREGKEYLYAGASDQAAFQEAYAEQFKAVPKFNLASMPRVSELIQE